MPFSISVAILSSNGDVYKSTPNSNWLELGHTPSVTKSKECPRACGFKKVSGFVNQAAA